MVLGNRGSRWHTMGIGHYHRGDRRRPFAGRHADLFEPRVQSWGGTYPHYDYKSLWLRLLGEGMKMSLLLRYLIAAAFITVFFL